MLEQSKQIEFIPLNKLSASKFNVRKTNRKADIEALSASIAAHGLLQNLSVVPKEQNRYEVVAGGRRLAALKSLAASGVIAKDFAVPCHIMTPENAGEASLVENIQRVSMDAMDEVDAFATLADTGSSIEDIARRFGCGARHVEQRLALARLSPKLKAAYRRGDLSLDAARAFCIVDDHARQEDVFKALGRHVTHAPSVRNHLMHGAMRANDRIARFVSAEAYEAAGGHITRDLFNEEEAYIDDPALMTKIASERFGTVREDPLAKGWGWVNLNLGLARFDGGSAERLQPKRRDMSDDERAALAEIDAEIEALDEALEDAEEDDTRWSEYDDLAGKRCALQEAAQEWDTELMKLAGVVISIDHNGSPNYAYGIVAKADTAKFRHMRKKRLAETERQQLPSSADEKNNETADGDGFIPPWEEAISNLPKTLNRELTRARTRTLRWKLSENPDTALALAVFAMSRRVIAGYPASGLDLDLRVSRETDPDSREAARDGLADIIPHDAQAALDWLLSQPRQKLLEIMAVLTASALDLSHECATREDVRKQGIADRLASVLDLDMSQHWRADMAFWSRLSKSALVEILMSAPCNAELSERQRVAFQKAQTKRTKNDIATSVAKALEGTNWLPDILITPKAQGAFEITEAGCAVIAAE